MASVQVFHNPKCGKSRGALEILANCGIEADVIEYLRTPPDRAALERIVDAIPDEPALLVRRGKRFDELGLDPVECTSREDVIGLLLENPELMERPVVFVGGRAVIARPPEKILDLLD